MREFSGQQLPLCFYLVVKMEILKQILLSFLFFFLIAPPPFSFSFFFVPSCISFLNLKFEVTSEEKGNQDWFCRRRSYYIGNIPVPSFPIFLWLSGLCSSYPIFLLYFCSKCFSGRSCSDCSSQATWEQRATNYRTHRASRSSCSKKAEDKGTSWYVKATG